MDLPIRAGWPSPLLPNRCQRIEPAARAATP
jgi:hypothetical protein